MKLRRKSELISGKIKTNTFTFQQTKQGGEALDMAKIHYDNLSQFRRERKRARQFTFGDQYRDVVKTSEGWKTEEDYIFEQGKKPLKNNIIRKLVKNVVGQFRSAKTQPICVARDRAEQNISEMMSNALQYSNNINDTDELDARQLEEFLISGIACHKTTFAQRDNKTDIWITPVNPNRLFFDTRCEDFRLWDCAIIGELHDLTINQVKNMFAKNQQQAQEIEKLYSESHNVHSFSPDNLDINFSTSQNGKCRVVEVWRKEMQPQYLCHDTLSAEEYTIKTEDLHHITTENNNRVQMYIDQGIPTDEVPLINYQWQMGEVWKYYFLTPTGISLLEGETPYQHAEHPYNIKIYPYIDKTVVSFVADFIDQQKYINRLITLIDFIMSSSAKGLLMFPENQIPDGMTMEDIAKEWTQYNGVILYKPQPGMPPPQQISTNATNVGAYELLNLQMKLIEDISGVHGAAQGREAAAGTPASMYAQQSFNSSINLVDILSSYSNFLRERALKQVKTIKQYYRDDKYINIAGTNFEEAAKLYQPKKVRDIDFDITISDGPAAPAVRLAQEDMRMQLLTTGLIDLEMYLQDSAMPGADKMLQQVQLKQQQMKEQQQIAMQQMQQQTANNNQQINTNN